MRKRCYVNYLKHHLKDISISASGNDWTNDFADQEVVKL